MLEITNDANKMLCCIYKSYLQQRKDGVPKSDAKRFESDFFHHDSKLSSWHDDDISDTLLELANCHLIKIYIGGNFDLTNEAIICMENRFKKGLSEVIDTISKLIP